MDGLTVSVAGNVAEIMAVIGMSLIAGWLVNLAADVLPGGGPFMRNLAQAWRWPVRQVLGRRTAPRGVVARPWRTAVVWPVALVLGFLALGQGFSATGLLAALYGWFFLAVAVIDLEHRRVLNVMLLALAPVAVAASLWLGHPGWGSALAGGALGFVLFLLVALVKPGGLGMGDVKLAGAIGLVTGLGGVLTALTIGIFAGGVVALWLVVRYRLLPRWLPQAAPAPSGMLTMAYAPYLVLGAWVAILF